MFSGNKLKNTCALSKSNVYLYHHKRGIQPAQKTENMAYFLRYTEQPAKDLKRGTSVHPSDFTSKKEATEAIGGDLVKVNGFWCQVIDGLCGFELEADNLEDAIEEIEDHRCGSYDFRSMGKMAVIFEGEITSEDIPEGRAFTPKSIAWKA